MKYFVTIWLAVVSFNCLIDATPLPEDRAKTPKEVQKINKWLGVDKKSDILKDILEVANAFTKIQENKQKNEDNADAIIDNADSISDNAHNITSNADDIEDNADEIDTLTPEVSDNADNIWYNTGNILDNAANISKNAHHIEAIKAIIAIIHPHSTTDGHIHTSTVVTSTVQTTTGASECTIDGYEPDDNQNCFKVGDTKLSWEKALKACKADGSAILATIPDNDANSFIKAKLSGNSWIGGNDLTKEGTWKWINGDSWGFENWKNGNDIKNKDEDCGYMASSDGKWQDEECTKKMHYVCMEK